MSYARAGAKAGLLAAIISNVLLGLSSLYWKALDEMSPFALLSYRVVFSTVSVTFILLARKELKCLLLEIKWKDVSLHGVVFYKEFISIFKGVALFFVLLSVLFLILSVPGLDFRVYLSIGVTWGAYTWLKKMARLDPVSGLFVESLLLSVMVVALVLYSDGGIEVPVGLTVIDWSLLLSCGLVSLIPLALFAFAAKNLPLSVMGLL